MVKSSVIDHPVGSMHGEEDSSEAAINLLIRASEMAKEGGHTY